jgi:hypothetical protein
MVLKQKNRLEKTAIVAAHLKAQDHQEKRKAT